jgi:hypothetical protein
VPSLSRLDPDPALPQRALDHHLALTTDGDPAPAATAQNASSTLCVLTGTRTVEDVRTTQHSSWRTEAPT